jgi:hypothetical protein
MMVWHCNSPPALARLLKELLFTNRNILQCAAILSTAVLCIFQLYLHVHSYEKENKRFLYNIYDMQKIVGYFKCCHRKCGAGLFSVHSQI